MPLFTIKTLKIDKKRIFLRSDLNVPIKNNLITNDFRLQSSLPTLHYLISRQAKIVLATHLGNPKKPETLVSTRLLIPWFAQHGITIDFASDIEHAQILQKNGSDIILLENLRLFPGEQSGDLTFARQLASLADIYINDAFGTIHRPDTSIALLPQQFDPSNRGIGLCVEQEIHALDKLKQHPAQPFVLVLGGAKLDDKIPLILQFLNAPLAQRPRTIIIGGALALPFLKVLDHNIGSIDLADQTVSIASTIIQQAAASNVSLLLPCDLATIQGALGQPSIIYPVDQIPTNVLCVDIGPKTIQDFTQALAGAETILVNGTMGIYEQPEYQTGTRSILQAIANSSGYTVAGGGDCSAAVSMFGLEKYFSFISTGGGATLAYLGVADPLKELPGLHALN